MIKVLEVISDTNIGGAGVLLINRLKHVDRSKFDTRVLLPSGSALTSKFCDIGIKCIEMDICGDRSMDIRAVKKFCRVIGKYSPDIINSHGCMSARIAAKLCGVPVKICTRHCVFPVSPKYRAIKPFAALFNAYLSDRFIAVAESAKGNLLALGVPENKISVIINGAEPLKLLDQNEKHALRQKLGISDAACVLSFCARLERCKGHEWFLDVVSELKKRGVHFVVLFIGDGSQRQFLMRKCRELGIWSFVRFIGFVDDTSPYMNIADININCSVGTETSSLALSEGMSVGLPAVVSDYGGNSYMIKHGVNGLVCKCYDYMAMADSIEGLIDDGELYSQLSYHAYRRFHKELNAANMARQTYRLYEKLYKKI